MAMATLWFADNDSQGTHLDGTRTSPCMSHLGSNSLLGNVIGQTMDMWAPLHGSLSLQGDYHYVWTGDEPAIWDVQTEKSSDTIFVPMKMT